MPEILNGVRHARFFSSFFFCCFFILYARSSINTHFLNLFIAKVGGLNELNGFVCTHTHACVLFEQFTRDSFGEKKQSDEERKKESDTWDVCSQIAEVFEIQAYAAR